MDNNFVDNIYKLNNKLNNFIKNELMHSDYKDYKIEYIKIISIILSEKPENNTFTIFSKKMGRSKADITLLVNKMVEEKIIVKCQNKQDKRKSYLSIHENNLGIIAFINNINNKIKAIFESVIDSEKLHFINKDLKLISNII